ncbi:hypothetical protein DICA2_C12970 [Diutina catenulata]
MTDDDIDSDSSVEEVFRAPKRQRVNREWSSSVFSVPWTEKYAPRSLNEVCINPTKLKQLVEAMRTMRDTGKRILIVSGPAGSVKSTAVVAVAQHTLGLPVIEYFDRGSGPGEFAEFLSDCRYRRGKQECVVLVEEFPNVFHGPTMASFRQAIDQWLHTEVVGSKLPLLVFVITEVEYGGTDAYSVENSFTADTVLGRALANHPKVQTVRFNSVAVRFTTKLLKRVVQGERGAFRHILPRELTEFTGKLATMGDVRSILANLQMWATLTRVKAGMKSQVHRPKLGQPLDLDLTSMFFRESSINVFHALGKVIFGSSESSKYSQDRSLDDFYSVEQVVTNFGDDSNVIPLGLVENYGIYKNGNYAVSVAADLLDVLSLADVMAGDEWAPPSRLGSSVSSRQIAQELSLRATRSYLAGTGTPSGVHKVKMRFPRHFKAQRRARQCRQILYQYQWYANSGIHPGIAQLNMVDGAYRHLIYNKRGGTRYGYGRLGGRFREIGADTEVDYADEIAPPLDELDQFAIEIKAGMARAFTNDNVSDEDLSDPISDESEPESDDFEFSDDDEVLLAQLA